MGKRLMSINVTELTEKQMAVISRETGMNKTDVVRNSVEHYFKTKATAQLVEDIYGLLGRYFEAGAPANAEVVNRVALGMYGEGIGILGEMASGAPQRLKEDTAKMIYRLMEFDDV